MKKNSSKLKLAFISVASLLALAGCDALPAYGETTTANTPTIGANGNWWIGKTDTGVKASGTDGVTPHIGTDGHWYIGDTDTGIIAGGQDVSYELTFDANGGVLPENTPNPMSVKEHKYASLPTPTKEGRTFEGWYTGFTANDGKVTNVTPIEADLSLVAEWNLYTVKWVDGNDNVVFTEEVEGGATLEAIGTVPTKTSDDGTIYAFDKWNVPTAPIHADTTITADYVVCKVTEVKLDVEKTVLEPEATYDLSKHLTVSVEGKAEKTVTYTSSDTAVATVSTAGVITAVAGGTATITVTSTFDTSKKATFNVSVWGSSSSVTFSELGYANATELTTVSNDFFSMTFDTATATNPAKYYTDGAAARMYVGGKMTVSSSKKIYKVVLTYSGENPLGTGSTAVGADAAGTWNNATGTWRGESTSVTFTSNAKARIASVEVYFEAEAVIPLEFLTMNKTTSELCLGGTDFLSVTYSPDTYNGDRTITWESTDTKVATVDSNGKVVGVTAGTATIKATCGEKTATCAVTVKNEQATTVTITTAHGVANSTRGQVVATTDNVTMTIADGANYGTDYRFYGTTSGVKNTMTISAPTGYVVTKAEFTCLASGTSKYGPGNLSAANGSYASEGTQGTWTGSEATASLTSASTAQARFTKVVVTLEKASTEISKATVAGEYSGT